MVNLRVIIAGGRDFNDLELLTRVCDEILQNSTNVTIVSGCANGADKLGELYAKLKCYEVTRFPADWETHGKSAGILRNKEMANNADALIAFWDGKSKTTKRGFKLVAVVDYAGNITVKEVQKKLW